MTKVSTLLATGILGIFLSSAAVAEDPVPQRVQFDPGTTGTTLEGEIRGYDVDRYVLGARAGQVLTVELATEHGGTSFLVYQPGALPGRDAAWGGPTFAGSPGFVGTLEQDGDVLLQVAMERAAARRTETASYTLKAEITGEPSNSGPGSPLEPSPFPMEWDARGSLRCSDGGEEYDRECPFTVKRNSSGATIWVIPPSVEREPAKVAWKELRTLYFDSGEWSTSDRDAGEVSAKRDEKVSDEWHVRVGSAERYQVFDAVIWGG